MKKKIAIVAGIIVVLLIIVLNVKKSDGGIEVRVQEVKKKELVAKVEGTGEIKPKKNVEISADISGKIVKIAVKEGDKVKKGQFLLQIDPEGYKADLESAKASLEATRAELIQAEANYKMNKEAYERAKELFRKGIISEEEFSRAEANYQSSLSALKALKYRIKQNQAAVKSAEERLKKTVITAPVDGVVTSLNVEEGEVAIIGTMNNPGTVLLTVADLSVMEAEVWVDETDIVRVKMGQKAKVTVDALPEVEFRGRVEEVGNSAQSSTGLAASSEQAKEYKVVVLLEGDVSQLKPGLTATAEIEVARKKDVLTVPISALVVRKVKGKEKEGVFVVKNEVAKFVPVKKGIMGEMEIEIKEGLKEGDSVIVGPFKVLRVLKDGQRVKVKKSLLESSGRK